MLLACKVGESLRWAEALNLQNLALQAGSESWRSGVGKVNTHLVSGWNKPVIGNQKKTSHLESEVICIEQLRFIIEKLVV